MVVMYQFMSSHQVAIEEEEEATLNKDRNVNYTDVLVTEVQRVNWEAYQLRSIPKVGTLSPTVSHSRSCRLMKISQP